jgi:hypothetical protein
MTMSMRPAVIERFSLNHQAKGDLHIQIDNLSDADWHTALSNFSDIHYEQSALFGSGQRGETDSHLLATQNGEPVFGARVGIYMLPVINRGLALVRFGPFWRHAGEPLDRERYKAAIQALIDEYCTRRKLYLIVRPRAHPDIYPIEAEILTEMGLQPKETTELSRYIVDSSLSEDEQRKSFGQQWRRNLKTALANNLEIRIGGNPEDVATFQAVYADMVERKHLIYPGVKFVDLMPQLTSLPQQMQMRVALAYHEGKPVAGLAFAVNGDIAYYVFGATNDHATELKAGYALQWSVLCWLREHSNIKWYELGGPGDAGIKQFKKGLAGKRGMLLEVQDFHYCSDPLARGVVKLLFAARSARNAVERWRRRH